MAIIQDGVSDIQAAVRNCRLAEGQHEIDDATARTIASFFYDGSDSVGYRFVSTGYIGSEPGDSSRLYDDLSDGSKNYLNGDSNDRIMLNMLGTYLLNRADKGAIAGWSKLWVR